MTPEEAIDILSTLAGYENTVALILDYSVSVQDALHMAIKALEQQPCEDCISREVVKDMLTAEWTKYMPMELDMNLSFILDKISALPSVTPQQTTWIPVSERLPKAGEYVGDVAKYYLVQNEFGDMLVARYTHSGHWEQIYQLKPIGDEIVAWMPLPEPYKAESEDKE